MPLRRRKNDSEDNSEISRAATATTGSEQTGPGGKAVCLIGFRGWDPLLGFIVQGCLCSGTQEQDHCQWMRGCISRVRKQGHPSWPGGQSIKPKRIIFEP